MSHRASEHIAPGGTETLELGFSCSPDETKPKRSDPNQALLFQAEHFSSCSKAAPGSCFSCSRVLIELQEKQAQLGSPVPNGEMCSARHSSS